MVISIVMECHTFYSTFSLHWHHSLVLSCWRLVKRIYHPQITNIIFQWYDVLTPVHSSVCHCAHCSWLHACLSIWSLNEQSASCSSFRLMSTHTAWRYCSPPPQDREHWKAWHSHRLGALESMAHHNSIKVTFNQLVTRTGRNATYGPLRLLPLQRLRAHFELNGVIRTNTVLNFEH